MAESRHLSVHIDRPVADVYGFVSEPANLPRWAAGLDTSVNRVSFAPANPYGVLDHEVLTPSGETVYMPVRAIADGDGCEVVITLRRAPGMSDAEFERDAAAVTDDLARLKRVVEDS